MTEFKAGDRVQCVISDYSNIGGWRGISIGEIVTVGMASDDVVFFDTDGFDWYVSHFEKVEEFSPAPPVEPSDPVNRPAHYARYPIEPITFISANNLPFLVGNVVKYVLRYDAKNGREDLLKAARCCEMLIEDFDRKAIGTHGDVLNRPL